MTPADRLAFEAHERSVSFGVALQRHGQSTDSLGAYHDPLVEQRWQGWRAALSVYRAASDEAAPPVDIWRCGVAAGKAFDAAMKTDTWDECCLAVARAVLREAGVSE